MAATATTVVDLQGKLSKLASGKVRDLFELNQDELYFVATDRISAYDVIMENVSLTAVGCDRPAKSIRVSRTKALCSLR